MKDPALRYQHAAEVRAALEAISVLAAGAPARPQRRRQSKMPSPVTPVRPPAIPRAQSVERRNTVGRAADHRALRNALAAVQTGGGLVIGVAGEPGLGKTTLAEAFVAGLQREGVPGTTCTGPMPRPSMPSPTWPPGSTRLARWSSRPIGRPTCCSRRIPSPR